MPPPTLAAHIDQRRIVTAIAAGAIAAATATAVAVSADTSKDFAAIATAFWLIVVCPFTATALTSVACSRACRCWLLTPLTLLLQPQTTAPCPICHPVSCSRTSTALKFSLYFCWDGRRRGR